MGGGDRGRLEEVKGGIKGIYLILSIIKVFKKDSFPFLYFNGEHEVIKILNIIYHHSKNEIFRNICNKRYTESVCKKLQNANEINQRLIANGEISHVHESKIHNEDVNFLQIDL